MTIDELAARMDERFAGLNTRIDGLNTRIDALAQTVEEASDASKARDEELRDLTKFGLEAREILRDEMHRRFDDTDRKHDEAIALLESAVRGLIRQK